MYIFSICSGLCAKEEDRLRAVERRTSVEKKNTAKLIRHKRKQRNLLLDLLVGVAGGAVFAAGTLLILVLYCYMRTA